MSPGLLLVLLLHAAEADPLAAARDAFARGDYGAAAALASAEARPPTEGEALYLVGLARFRAGRPADALAAFDAAGAATDAPPRGDWQFNRAACLYALGRFPEAERAFQDAADAAPRLAALALANAGFAALDAGERDRAAALSARARSLAQGAAAPLLDDLDAQIARDRARALVSASSNALREGDRVEARRRAREALALPLEPDDAARARALVERTSPGMISRGTGWDLTLRIGAGYDSNVLQSGIRGSQDYVPIATGEVSSGGLVGSAALGVRVRAIDRVHVEAGYGVEQVAWLASEAADYSLQVHSLGVAAEWEARDWIRSGIAILGQSIFTGLSGFRGLQSAAGGSAWVALDETDATTTRLDAGWTRKWGSGAEFDYLTGRRLDLGASQQVRIRSAVLELGYRYRDESIGTLVTSTTTVLRITGCAMMGCPVEYTEPFSYRGHSVLLGARAPLGGDVHVGALTGLEWRTYRGEDVLRATITGGMMSVPTEVELYRQRREDRRFLAVVYATWRLAPRLSLAVRYDLTVNSSTIEGTYDDRNYTKQVGTIETVFSW